MDSSVHTGMKSHPFDRGECDLSFSFAEGWVFFKVPEVKEYGIVVIGLPGECDEHGLDG